MLQKSWMGSRSSAGPWWACAGLLVVSCTAGAVARADTILAYPPDNSPDGSVAVDVMSGVTPLQLTRGDGLNAGSGNTYNSSGWNDEPADYLQWGWMSAVPIDLVDLDLRYDRSNSGPSTVDIQLSVDGGAFSSVFADGSVEAVGEDVLDVDLSGYTGVSSATFRLFGSGASAAGGTFDIEALTGVSPPRGIIVSGALVIGNT